MVGTAVDRETATPGEALHVIAERTRADAEQVCGGYLERAVEVEGPAMAIAPEGRTKA
ncbi:hypothetical protein [Nocardia sp. NPDC051463]|uniref:hypothetical protein n=1 Tax=Nocardia sp. NPDC051463 TaxID=3154845 RepID=UPI00344E7EC7